MKDLQFLSKSELISYFSELQPVLKWDFDRFSCVELKELIEMHFSVYDMTF